MDETNDDVIASAKLWCRRGASEVNATLIKLPGRVIAP
jgi:hypothetical protein